MRLDRLGKGLGLMIVFTKTPARLIGQMSGACSVGIPELLFRWHRETGR
ncbi:MAG: hypothetical protein GX162_02550 [Firmicutes bacterium]|jgi:hypothetical protein|nr:hypothetical protein [Bacillota bacterium]